MKGVGKISILIIGLILLMSIANAQSNKINTSNIDIVRDKWGVPHIYGKTDAEASYGLAWATCEDDFKTVQELILAVKGKLGQVEGKSGAILDFLSYITGVDSVVELAYDTALSPQYKKVLEGYVEGLNDYAASHPDEILLKKAFPVTGKDIIKDYVFTNVMLASIYMDIAKIFKGYISNYEIKAPAGSNAFAFSGKRTEDGKTYLAINSHQPLEGLFSWYEAHLNSEEGLNILGGTFPGGMSIMVGANQNLGWACTLSYPDVDDVYKLSMNPYNRLQYWFDGHWEMLAIKKKTVKVKLGGLQVPVTKTFYESKYGITIKNKSGEYYAIRFPANMDIRSGEQVYRLNKATNFTEWHDAMRMNTMPCMNFIYADRTDTIFYVSVGEFPQRNPSYNWLKVLPGNTSKTLWRPNFYPVDSLPQKLNPKSGYLVNTNNSCFDVSAIGDNPDSTKCNHTFGFGPEKNNRIIMAQSLINKLPKLNYEQFKNIKYNVTYNDSLYDYHIDNMITLLKLDAAKYPDIADAIKVIRNWNRQCDANNKEASLMLFTLYHLIDKLTEKSTGNEYNTFDEIEYVGAVKAAKHHMLKYFGSFTVPLGEVQKHVRGNVELPVSAFPEVLAAMYTLPYKKGMRKTYVGESYIELVRFSKSKVEIESVNAFGSSNKPGSPHYTDQMQMFVDQKLKPMTLDKETIYRDAEKIYHPNK